MAGVTNADLLQKVLDILTKLENTEDIADVIIILNGIKNQIEAVCKKVDANTDRIKVLDENIFECLSILRKGSPADKTHDARQSTPAPANQGGFSMDGFIKTINGKIAAAKEKGYPSPIVSVKQMNVIKGMQGKPDYPWEGQEFKLWGGN